MGEKYPVHLMIKPEGLEYFPEFIHSELELFELMAGVERTTRVVTRLTPDEVSLIYPPDKFSPEVRNAIASGKTEHYIFHGSSDIYNKTRMAKGKANVDWGIRGRISREVDRVGLKFEKWQNFIHSTDTLEDTKAICFHFNKDMPACIGCVAKTLCYGNLEGSDMPEVSISPLEDSSQ